MNQKQKSAKLAKIFAFLKSRKAVVFYLPMVLLLVTIIAYTSGIDLAQAQLKGEDSNFIADAVSGLFNNIGNFVFSGGINLISALLVGLVELVGGLVGLALTLLKMVASYGINNEFAAQTEVIIGWTIVRDTINSFFIVVLIGIAISTIIRFQPFNFRQALPKLILAAILVNFSRTLCLLAINFSTAVMFTFIDAIGEAWPGFLVGLRAPAVAAIDRGTLSGLYGTAKDVSTEQAVIDAAAIPINQLSAILAAVIAIIMLMIVFIALMYIVIILVVRIVTLWMLMILSPLAFFLYGVPGSKASSYWSEWLQEFIKHVIVGPLLAFFLYLDILFFVTNTTANYGMDPKQIGDVPGASITLITTPKIFLGYVISLAILLIGLELSQKLGVRGGAMAKRLAVGAPLAAGRGLGGLAFKGARRLAEDLHTAAVGKGMPHLGKAYEAYEKGREARKLLAEKKGKKIWRDKAAEIQRAGGRFAPAKEMVARALGADEGMWEKHGLVSGISDRGSALSRVKRMFAGGASAEGVQGAYQAVAQQEAAMGARGNYVKYAGSDDAKSLMGPGGAFENVSYNELAAGIEREEKNLELAGLEERNFDNLIEAGSDEEKKFKDLKAWAGTDDADAEMQTMEEGGEAIDSELVSTNLKKLQELKSNIDAARDIGDAPPIEGTELEYSSDQAVSGFAAAVAKRAEKGQDDTIRKRLRSEMTAQDADYQLIVREGDKDRKADEAKYRKENYDQDNPPKSSELVSDAQLQRQTGDAHKFTAVLKQAAHQNDFNDVIDKMGYVNDGEGLTAFRDEVLMAPKAKGGLGMTERDSMQVLHEVGGISKKRGQYANADLTVKDGQAIRFASKTEAAKNFTKNAGKDLVGTITKGMGTEMIKGKDGKYTHSDAAVKLFSRNADEVYKIIARHSGTMDPKKMKAWTEKTITIKGQTKKVSMLDIVKDNMSKEIRGSGGRLMENAKQHLEDLVSKSAKTVEED